VPRKTAADKARSSAKYWKEEIKKAYPKQTSKDLDGPLTQAMRWLYAALAQRAEEDPSSARELYKHATDQLAGFAEQIQGWIIEESEKGK
jgi:hypothetical protein